MSQSKYDEVAYPSVVFPQTSPERLATLAHIYGLTAPDVARARVLEIGGSDGLGGMAFAAAFPNASVTNFDLSTTAIARGQAKVDAGGFTNVTHEVLDIMAAREHYAARSFDYVVAHGVYAWVPDFVREEVMRLIGHVLSDEGIAFISFNATPGGHMRRITRDMLTFMLKGIDHPQDRIAAMRECLSDFVKDQPNDSPLMTGVRMHARSMLEGDPRVVFHDELGPEYNPQQLSHVAAAAEAVGLSFLTDAGRNLFNHGFVPDDYVGEPFGADADARALRIAQMDDFATMRFFRQALFIRHGRAPRRRLESDRLRDLFLTTDLAHHGGSKFANARQSVEIGDEQLSEMIKAAAARGNSRSAVADYDLGDRQLAALFQLFLNSFVDLRPGPDPFVSVPGERPTVSPLIRAQLSLGESEVDMLDGAQLRLEQAEMQRLLIAADGTRTMDELCALPDLGPLAGDVPQVLAEAARRAMLVA